MLNKVSKIKNMDFQFIQNQRKIAMTSLRFSLDARPCRHSRWFLLYFHSLWPRLRSLSAEATAQRSFCCSKPFYCGAKRALSYVGNISSYIVLIWYIVGFVLTWGDWLRKVLVGIPAFCCNTRITVRYSSSLQEIREGSRKSLTIFNLLHSNVPIWIKKILKN